MVQYGTLYIKMLVNRAMFRLFLGTQSRIFGRKVIVPLGLIFYVLVHHFSLLLVSLLFVVYILFVY